MNPRARRVALYGIAAIAILASGNALAHSYAGLYGWAIHHRLAGWQAMSWPAEIDVFLAAGELALYVAYLDGWPARQRVWPWVTAVAGLAVSVAGNIGHIQPQPGHPVLVADRLTAATSPLAAFAGLSVGLLVLRMNRQMASGTTQLLNGSAARPLTAAGAGPGGNGHLAPVAAGIAAAGRAAVGTAAPGSPRAEGRPLPGAGPHQDQLPPPDGGGASRLAGQGVDPAVLRAAGAIYRSAAARGEAVSQRMLARQLRGGGHRFSNQHLRRIAAATTGPQLWQATANGRHPS